MNIGICGYWGWSRGQSYVNLMFANMLKKDHKVYVFNPVVTDKGVSPYEEKEFDDEKISVTDYKNGWMIEPEVFKTWIRVSKLDAIIFNEYGQWGNEDHDLIQIARDEGCKVYGYLVSERFKKNQADRYDRVFCPNMSQVRLMRHNRVRNFTLIPFSLDLEKYKPAEKKDNSKFVFLHPAGYIGVNERKNTSKVIEAFRMLDKKDAKLVVISQVDIKSENLPENVEIVKDVSHDELIEHYKQAHVLVYSPKWETIGISILESLACGTPVITTDFPPMNEYVLPNKNGLLCKGHRNRYRGISVDVAEVSAEDIKDKMEIATNEIVLALMQKNSRYVVEEIYNIDENKKKLLEFLRKDVGDKDE